MKKEELKHYINVRFASFGIKKKNGLKNARFGVKSIRAVI